MAIDDSDDEALARHVAAVTPSETHGTVSKPASAWEVVCNDRDVWKRRALEAESKVRDLEARAELLLERLAKTLEELAKR